ncbi:FecR domain-containing protein [Candidatus Omnitrophota bacterium]
MRKILLAVLAVSIFTVTSFAEDVRIFEIKGRVMVRENEDQRWRKAKEGEHLDTNYELLTKKNAECTFSFGEKLERAMTIKQNSQIKIADIDAGNLELPKGRVFSLIERMDKEETFQIRTPTAVAGVRGTGWSMESGKQTSVRCFEGEVAVKGLDEQGNVVTDKKIEQGSGTEVAKGGEIAEPVAVTEKEKKEWNSFKDVVKDLIGKPLGEASKVVGDFSEGAVEGYLGDDGENPFGR